MLTEKQKTKISKFLSLVLRHKPETIGIELDPNGWTDIHLLIEKSSEYGIPFNRDVLFNIVETNAKRRFALNESQDKIRASQGHSVQIELGYVSKEPPVVLYHGTAEKSVNSILKSGLEKRNRQHVHLSSNIGTATKVGQRHGKPVILEISSLEMHKANFKFYLSDNGVWLTDKVPIKYISKM